ncbi:uncharacterized protein LY79DRAFT_182487 [Colletotrichum navitas]|uniref:Uncharacterized protein n=1 Tax=Colletotrichum navitas TaxID=681940 RepID=A0AAD8Q0U6_9PEZI|nr:uncharacterized protein LY79DRAFT_182487 [Colletotrichum navitas]KAK1593277.1 hypothetical protein LY79DRAFT_182487 [Colletotrichum navitas]
MAPLDRWHSTLGKANASTTCRQEAEDGGKVNARIEVRLGQRYCCSATCASSFLDLIFVRMHEGFLCIRLTLQVCKYVIRNSMGPYPLYATWSKEPNLHFLVTTRAFGRCMVDERLVLRCKHPENTSCQKMVGQESKWCFRSGLELTMSLVGHVRTCHVESD